MVSQSVVRMSRSQYPMPSGTREQVQHGREDMRAKEPQQRGDCAGHDEAGFRSRCPPPPHKVQVHLGGLHVTRVEQHQSRRIRLQPTSSPSNRATLDHAARQVSLLAACK